MLLLQYHKQSEQTIEYTMSHIDTQEIHLDSTDQWMTIYFNSPVASCLYLTISKTDLTDLLKTLEKEI